MSRVARFGKKAQVGELESLDQLAMFSEERPGVSCMEEGVNKQEKQKQTVQCQVN